ncbi:MAG: ABC transporter ATP-binding protein [Planctomycetia bacterium]|nr:ABC transporter ATP-binding protein [Planctomycetia bacterium]
MVSGFLDARDIRRDFQIGDRSLPVLRGVDLSVEPGDVVAIVGPSGAGKSTFLHILGLLDRPTSGSVMFKGQAYSDLGDRERARMRNSTFSFVFQFYHLLPELTALENALMPVMIQSSILAWPVLRGEARRKARELLERMGMGERLHHVPGRLSGGERQRVAIARALMTSPEVVFCDEPTGNLDTVTSQEIQDLLWSLAEEKCTTFVMVTHEPSLARRAHRVVRMVDGLIVDGEVPPTTGAAVPPASAPSPSPNA